MFFLIFRTGENYIKGTYILELVVSVAEVV